MIEILPEVFLFRKSLDEPERKALWQIYQQEKPNFYRPTLRSGHKMKLEMACLGKHWSPVDYRYHETRTDHDGLPVSPYNKVLTEIATRHKGQTSYNYGHDWDLCIINRYKSQNSTLGMHQDNSESQKCLIQGHPVVSFSLGASCIFKIGGLRRTDPVIDVTLNSGDVLIFEGTSRLRYHGVVGLVDSPEDCEYLRELNYGRLNFTVRKY